MVSSAISSSFRRLFPIALAVFFVLAFAGSPAWADGHHRHFKHHHHYRPIPAHVVIVPQPLPPPPAFVVPTYIAHDEFIRYRPYYSHRYWNPRHHCWHQVYRFPVQTGRGVIYQPYAYADGRLIVDAVIPAPGLQIGVHINR